MDSYRTELLAERGGRPMRSPKGAQADKTNRAEERRLAADRRAGVAPLRKAMQVAESAVAKLITQLAKLDADLAEPELYSDAVKTKRLTFERGQLAKKLEAAEDSWLTATEAFEQASAAVEA